MKLKTETHHHTCKSGIVLQLFINIKVTQETKENFYRSGDGSFRQLKKQQITRTIPPSNRNMSNDLNHE